MLLIAALFLCADGANIPINGLQFYYMFNKSTVKGGTVKDASINGHDLTSSKDSIQLGNDLFGNGQNALSMDGTYNLSCTLPDTLVHRLTDMNDFTFGLMFSTNAPSGSMTQRMDIAGIGDPYNSGIFLSMTYDRVRIFLGNHGYYDTPDSLNDAGWHSAIVVRSQGAVVLYIDGKVADQGAVTASIYPGTDQFVIGKHGTKNESYYKGLINDVFYYSAASSANDISNLYKAFTCPPISVISPFDTFSTTQPLFKWHPETGTIAYAFEMSTDSLFTKPFLSVPLIDTTIQVAQPLATGRYFVHVGCNSDDRSPFYFSDWHPVVIR